jgi:DNA primase
MRSLRPDALRRLSQLSPVAELAAEYGLDPRDEGGHVVARCPFASSCGRQLVLEPATNRFRCDGCAAWGNFLTLVVLVEGLPAMAALRHLAERAGIAFDELLTDTDDATPRRKSGGSSTVPLWALTPPPFER